MYSRDDIKSIESDPIDLPPITLLIKPRFDEFFGIHPDFQTMPGTCLVPGLYVPVIFPEYDSLVQQIRD